MQRLPTQPASRFEGLPLLYCNPSSRLPDPRGRLPLQGPGGRCRSGQRRRAGDLSDRQDRWPRVDGWCDRGQHAAASGRATRRHADHCAADRLCMRAQGSPEGGYCEGPASGAGAMPAGGLAARLFRVPAAHRARHAVNERLDSRRPAWRGKPAHGISRRTTIEGVASRARISPGPLLQSRRG